MCLGNVWTAGRVAENPGWLRQSSQQGPEQAAAAFREAVAGKERKADRSETRAGKIK